MVMEKYQLFHKNWANQDEVPNQGGASSGGQEREQRNTRKFVYPGMKHLQRNLLVFKLLPSALLESQPETR